MPKKKIPKTGNLWLVHDTYSNDIVDTFYCNNEQEAIERINSAIGGSDIDPKDIEIIRGTKFKLEIGAIKLVKET